MRVRIIPDSKELGIRLNKLILFNRIILSIGVIVGVIGLFTRKIFLITIGILALIIGYFFSRKQTMLNIELGARLLAIDGKENPDFQKDIESIL